MKTALLVVSFGTTHPDTISHTIAATEQAICDALPQLPFYRAFTSGIVRSRLEDRRGIHVDSVEEALGGIRADGCSRVLIQPTLITPGGEYERLKASIRTAAGDLTVSIGWPLIRGEADMDRITSILRDAYPLAEDTALLLMGHGSRNSGYELYQVFNQRMQNSPMRICTMEGRPSLADGVLEMCRLGVKNVTLAPLLFAAGEHARIHMAGDGPDSLRSMLIDSGFSVTPILRGLGELEGIRQLYAGRAQEAFSQLSSF